MRGKNEGLPIYSYITTKNSTFSSLNWRGSSIVLVALHAATKKYYLCYNTTSPWPRPTHTKYHLSPSSRLDTTDISRKLGGYAPIRKGAGSPSNTMSLRLRPTSVSIDICQKLCSCDSFFGGAGLLCPLFGEQSWVPI